MSERKKPTKKEAKAMQDAALAELAKRQPKTATFVPATDVEGLGADWKDGAVHVHCGTMEGVDAFSISTAHKPTGNIMKFAMTEVGLECLVRVGTQMLARLRDARSRRN